jgi:pyruvate kinase
LGAFDGDPARLQRLIGELEELRTKLLQFEEKFGDRVSKVHRAYEASARNLLHYIAMRQYDIRKLQEELASLGLSSLGRSESHVMASLTAVLQFLHKAANLPPRVFESRRGAVTYHEGQSIIDSHTESELGAVPPHRSVRIMVTLPSEAAGDRKFVRGILKSGMDCARINCAHDDEAAWGRMVANIRAAERELGRPCRILMDLPGPKLRTGEIAPGPRVVRWRTRKDACGRVVEPTRVWLTAGEKPEPPPVAAPALPIPAATLARAAEGDELHFADARDRQRRLRFVQRVGEGWWAEAERAAYVCSDTALSLRRAGTDDAEPAGVVGDLPAAPQALELFYDDVFALTADPAPGRPATRDAANRAVESARISCTLPEIFADVKKGERIWLDDGKIGGVIERATRHEVDVRIVRAKPGGSRLLADKGINLPDSDLSIKGLTAQDIACLPFIATHADLVAMSFVRGPDDVLELQAQLAKLRAEAIGIVLKIETRKALERLPAILLAAMRSYPIGVMIARGDLAVEVGYERLAEAQEEILWICEASHVPVIWATQVLENLTKAGLPSRAEITDAAMSVRAECVMLNKGPYILESIRVLDDILHRMEAHQKKKATLLGRLDVSDLGG